MGWTSYHASYYKNGKVDRKAECDAYFLVSILKLLSETENEFANAWREACLAYAKSEKQKRALDRFPVGTKICFPVLSDMGKDIKKGDIIHLWKTASGNWIDGQYRWAKKLINGDYVVE